MARTNDPNSATAQFFINQRSNLRLDWTPSSEGYTVFGEVIDGMQVVDIISLSDTGPAPAKTAGVSPLFKTSQSNPFRFYPLAVSRHDAAQHQSQ